MSRTEDTATAISIRPCASHDDLKLCVDLQRRIWGFAEEDLVPTAMFVVAQHTGGHAYCAFDQNQAIGFALAFSAEHDGKRIWHSHMVGVLPEYQNRGVGRMLKSYQRDEAMRSGVESIEWTFDPMETRNAYFNIARLGAVVRRYIPDCYGPATSPLHAGLPTDRLVAEWRVGSERVRKILTGTSTGLSASGTEISIPADVRDLKNSGDGRAGRIQAEMREKFMDRFAQGYAVTGFRRGSEKCAYILERYEN